MIKFSCQSREALDFFPRRVSLKVSVKLFHLIILLELIHGCSGFFYNFRFGQERRGKYIRIYGHSKV